MQFTTSLLYNQYNGNFLLFRDAWFNRYFDRKDRNSSNSTLRDRTLQYLDLYVRELASLDKTLEEYERYVLDKKRDIIPPGSDLKKESFKRQRQYFVYKTLRDMFKDTYIEDYPSEIDRDGDWVMILWDITQT